MKALNVSVDRGMRSGMAEARTMRALDRRIKVARKKLDRDAGHIVLMRATSAQGAPPLGDLNAIHPFREGNGRVMRAFITRLSQQQGLVFDQTLIDPQRWNEASKVNFQTADATVLRDLLRDAMRSL